MLGVGFHDPHFKWHFPREVWERYAGATIATAKCVVVPRRAPRTLV